jgi:hypothetical protein
MILAAAEKAGAVFTALALGFPVSIGNIGPDGMPRHLKLYEDGLFWFRPGTGPLGPYDGKLADFLEAMKKVPDGEAAVCRLAIDGAKKELAKPEEFVGPTPESLI